MQNLDLNNLVLDDNNYSTVPEGDYHFEVEDYDIAYSTSDKFPENTQVITVHLSVPVMSDGERKTVSVRKDLPVCSKMLWLLRQFCECISLMPEKGRAKMPELDKIIGCKGVFHLITGISAKGNEYNSVDTFFAPSKAPMVCTNDDAWNAKPAPVDGFQPGDEAEVNPFAV